MPTSTAASRRPTATIPPFRATARARPARRATSRRPPTANCSSCRRATRARRSRSAATRCIWTAPLRRRRRQLDLARPHDRDGRGQPRPADLPPQPRFQRARQPDPQRQCGGRPAVRLRDAHHIGRGRELVAGRSPELHHQLDPRGRRADASTSSAIRCSKRRARGSSISPPARRCSPPPITGGNPDLLADKRNVWKLGANWQPFANTQLRLRADYVHSQIDRPISNITVTEAIEAAFPDRFERDSVRASWSASTCGRSISTARARTRFASGSISPSRSSRSARRNR